MITSKVPKFTQNICNSYMQQIMGSYIFSCNHEEGYTRMFFHLSNAAQNDIKCALIKAVDTDVVVIALSYFLDLEIDEL